MWIESLSIMGCCRMVTVIIPPTELAHFHLLGTYVKAYGVCSCQLLIPVFLSLMFIALDGHGISPCSCPCS